MYYISRIVGVLVILIATAFTLLTLKLDFFTTTDLLGVKHAPTYIIGVLSATALGFFFGANRWIINQKPAFRHNKAVYIVSLILVIATCLFSASQSF